MVWKEIEFEFENKIWNPKTTGEQLGGRVADKKIGEYGVYYVIEDSENNLHITPSHRQLQDIMNFADIKVNDVVQIYLKEIKQTKKTDEMRIYGLRVWITEKAVFDKIKKI